MSSHENETINIEYISLCICIMFPLVYSFIICRSLIPSFLRRINVNPVVKVISPKPPIWINNSITTCPKALHWDHVSNTVRPVTQVLEVAVKRASINVGEVLRCDMGSINNKVPAMIIIKKLSTINLTGGIFLILRMIFSNLFKMISP